MRIRIRDLESFWWKNSDPGSGINIPDPQHCVDHGWERCAPKGSLASPGPSPEGGVQAGGQPGVQGLVQGQEAGCPSTTYREGGFTHRLIDVGGLIPSRYSEQCHLIRRTSRKITFSISNIMLNSSCHSSWKYHLLTLEKQLFFLNFPLKIGLFH
jgi:hypothetical protein